MRTNRKNFGKVLIALIVINLVIFAFRADLSYASSENDQFTSPRDRTMHAMVYDSTNQKTILFGGSWDTLTSGFQQLEDTWAYDYNSSLWTELAPTTHPSARDSHAMVFDSTANQAILFGGGPTDTWTFSFPSNTWTRKSTGTSPPSLYYHAMVYDPVNQKVILFGGLNERINDEFWVYDPVTNVWTELNPSMKPEARYGHTMVYDSTSQKIILFGGNSAEGYRDDTWEYDYITNTWNELNPATHPSPRYWHSMIYDTTSQKGLLFGGFGGSPLNETWIYDYNINTWELLSSSVSPSPRTCTAFAYDSINHKGILFGGYVDTGDSVATLGDMWIYHPDNNSWTLRNTSSSTSTTSIESTNFLTLGELMLVFVVMIGIFREKERS
ncbi:MAG: Kelch repeat-containing protein [Candidatus Odinarchaeota archaeon]